MKKEVLLKLKMYIDKNILFQIFEWKEEYLLKLKMFNHRSILEQTSE
jgi:hypothetical protein